MASQTRDLTRGLALKKSDESQKLRAGDRFRRYADVSGVPKTWWGQRPRGGGERVPTPAAPRVDEADRNRGGGNR